MKTILFRVYITPILIVLFCTIGLNAQRSPIERSGDIIQFVTVGAGLTAAIVENGEDRPVIQLVEGVVASTLITHAFKRVIGKKRPNGGNYGFPSGHTTFAMTGAGFLQRRYGWKIGLPAYLAAAWVGYSRIYAHKHDIYDVIAGTVVGVGCAYVFTKPVSIRGTSVGIEPTSTGLGLIARW